MGKAAGIVFDTGGIEIFREGTDASGNGVGLGIVSQVS